MKKIIRLTESDLLRIVKRVINEESNDVTSSDFYSSILGYIDMNWKSLIDVGNRDTFDMRLARKEVLIYCEDMRDNKKAKPLTSNLSKSMFKTISKLVKESPNIQELIKRGKNIKVNRFA